MKTTYFIILIFLVTSPQAFSIGKCSDSFSSDSQTHVTLDKQERSFGHRINKLLKSPFSASGDRSAALYEARALSIGYTNQKPLSVDQPLKIKQDLNRAGTAVVLAPPLFNMRIARKISKIIFSDLSMNDDLSKKNVPFYWDRSVQNFLRWFRGNRYKKDIVWIAHTDIVSRPGKDISWKDFKALLSQSGRISEKEIALFERDIFAFLSWLSQAISEMEDRPIRPIKFFLRTQNGKALPPEGHNHKELTNTSVWISSTYAIFGPGTWFKREDDSREKFITPDKSALLFSEPVRNMVLFPGEEKSLPYHGNPYDIPGDRLLLVSFFEAAISSKENYNLKKKVEIEMMKSFSSN